MSKNIPEGKTSVSRHTTGVMEKESSAEVEHICVCICTYQRPKLLENLLNGMTQQKTCGKFSYSIVVVDNDPDLSAEAVVSDYLSHPKLSVEYFSEPTKGLSYARNKSIENSSGDYIAILDDDEVPASDWLFRLFETLKRCNADGVFGSVIPNFEVDPPGWVLRRKFFYWRDVRKETGTVTTKYVTNNVLFRRDLIRKFNVQFDHDFAHAGGEDYAFFFKIFQQKPDAKFLNCKDAVVYEFLTADRCKPAYIQKRNILEGRGRVVGMKKFSKNRRQQVIRLTQRFIQSFLKVVLILGSLPFLFIINRDLAAEYYYRNFYHIGLLLAVFHSSPYEDRRSIGLH